MTGNVLAHHEAGTYRPSWEIFPHWVIQAQYYWQDPEGEAAGSHALCGPAVRVEPGDRITTRIAYSGVSTQRYRALYSIA
jgi:hypothetical protein